MGLRSNFNTREINSRENYRFFGHNSAPCGNFWTILRHKLPIIHPDLPIPSNNLNSNVQPEFLNPNFQRKIRKNILISLIHPFLGDLPPGRWTGARMPASHPGRLRRRTLVSSSSLRRWRGLAIGLVTGATGAFALGSRSSPQVKMIKQIYKNIKNRKK